MPIISERDQNTDWTTYAIDQGYGAIGEVAEGKIPLELFEGYTFNPPLAWYQSETSGNLCDEASSSNHIDIVLSDDACVSTDGLIQDAYVRKYYPNTNYNDDRLNTGVLTWNQWNAYNGGNCYTFIRFNVNDFPSNVNVAKLRLWNRHYQDSGGAGYLTGYLLAHQVMEDWNEDTVTWNSMPMYNTNSFSQSAEFNIEEDQYVELDITSLYNSWKSGEPNYGIMLNTNGSDEAGECYGGNTWNCKPGGWYSSEYEITTKRPELIITP
jgi:hypothetical protein